MKLNKTYWVVALLAVLLSACSSTEEKDADLLDGSQSTAVDTAATSGYDDGSGLSGSDDMLGNELTPEEMGAEFTDPMNPLSKHTIYFMYDSSQVQQDFIPVIAAHAQFLLAHPKQHMVLQGHADERGTREYNIALGEQRAKAVARMMKMQGVQENQLEIVSYGEEKPAAEGHDEASWQLNRRVELVYLGWGVK